MRCPPQWGCEEPSSHFQKYWLIQFVLAIDSGSIGLVHSHYVLPSTSNVWRGRGEAIWSCTKVSNSQKGCSVDWPRLSLNTLCVYHLKGGPIGGQLLRQWCRSSACLIQPSLALHLRLSAISTMVIFGDNCLETQKQQLKVNCIWVSSVIEKTLLKSTQFKIIFPSLHFCLLFRSTLSHWPDLNYSLAWLAHFPWFGWFFLVGEAEVIFESLGIWKS